MQLDKLGHCENVFEEKTNATSCKRPQLDACLEYVRAGGTLIMTRLDRLARSTLNYVKGENGELIHDLMQVFGLSKVAVYGYLDDNQQPLFNIMRRHNKVLEKYYEASL